VLLVIEKQVTIARFMGQFDVQLFAFSAMKTQLIATRAGESHRRECAAFSAPLNHDRG
jgi:hypothetical protein